MKCIAHFSVNAPLSVQLPRTPNHFLLPRHWTRDPRLLVKLMYERSRVNVKVERARTRVNISRQWKSSYYCVRIVEWGAKEESEKKIGRKRGRGREERISVIKGIQKIFEEEWKKIIQKRHLFEWILLFSPAFFFKKIQYEQIPKDKRKNLFYVIFCLATLQSLC